MDLNSAPQTPAHSLSLIYWLTGVRDIKQCGTRHQPPAELSSTQPALDLFYISKCQFYGSCHCAPRPRSVWVRFYCHADGRCIKRLAIKPWALADRTTARLAAAGSEAGEGRVSFKWFSAALVAVSMSQQTEVDHTTATTQPSRKHWRRIGIAQYTALHKV